MGKFESSGVFEGRWVDDEVVEGKYKDNQGNKYKGKFQKGRIQGEGTCTMSNGDRYQGMFLEGKFHGQGKMYYKHINVAGFSV